MSLASPKRAALLAALEAALGSGALLTSDADLAIYSRDWSGEYSGRPLAVARPRSAAELCDVVAKCRGLRIPIVPQGGLTGLVGGAVARQNEAELVVSLERLDAIRNIDPDNYSMVVEAGCVLETAKRAAEAQDRLLPITFGAQGSCRIGGNVATNAGGVNVLRYGMTRDLVLGLELVLPDGRLWSHLSPLRKDNRGYDLKQLFIGSEGTLGVVTAVAFKLYPLPTRVETALVGLSSVMDAMSLFARARRDCGDLLSAFELLLQEGVDIAMRARPDLAPPLAARYPAYVLMEASTSAAIDLKEMLVGFLASSDDLVRDGVVAASRAQADRLWLYREAMVEHQGRGGRYFRTDVSVRISDLPAFVERAMAAVRARLPEALPVAYGHVGDGNVHLNVIPPEGLDNAGVDALFVAAEEAIFEIVDQLDGSISAEHGIGRAKRKAFLSRIDAVTLDLMTTLKRSLDPADLMSPGRILPSSREAI
jgi:FAD/FMN-containing dehydrogenase